MTRPRSGSPPRARVDDGKSTLVGRLLYDTKSVLADQLDAVHRASVDKGLSTPDLSLLVDGLRSEREQGITIDVAYRYFATPRRTFVLADTPGHVQYTRNTVTGASTAQLAILLVDARKGVVEQTRRHAAVLALLGVPRLVLAVNKIDLVDYDQETFEVIAKEFGTHAAALGYADRRGADDPGVRAARRQRGGPLGEHARGTPGPTLLEHLETVPVEPDPHEAPLRFPVQYVIRPRTAGAPGLPRLRRPGRGRAACGRATRCVVLPAGLLTKVTRVDTPDGSLTEATAGRSVTLLLADDIDISRGDLIVGEGEPPRITDELDATLAWLADKPLRPGARVLVKHGARTVRRSSASCAPGSTSRSCPPWTRRSRWSSTRSARSRCARPSRSRSTTTPRHGRTGAFLVIDPADGTTLAAGLVGAPLPVRGRARWRRHWSPSRTAAGTRGPRPRSRRWSTSCARGRRRWTCGRRSSTCPRPGCPTCSPRCTATGHRDVVVVPLLLGKAFHARVDLPSMVAEATARLPRLSVSVSGVLGPDPRLPSVALRRLRAAGARLGDPSLGVILAAAGSSHAPANLAVSTVASSWASLGWAGVEAAFASTAQPDVPAAAAALRARGARADRRGVVVPRPRAGCRTGSRRRRSRRTRRRSWPSRSARTRPWPTWCSTGTPPPRPPFAATRPLRLTESNQASTRGKRECLTVIATAR